MQPKKETWQGRRAHMALYGTNLVRAIKKLNLQIQSGVAVHYDGIFKMRVVWLLPLLRFTVIVTTFVVSKCMHSHSFDIQKSTKIHRFKSPTSKETIKYITKIMRLLQG